VNPIAYVFPRGDLGGAEIATLRLIEAHDRKRYEPFALLLEDGPVGARLEELGIAYDTAPALPRLRDGRSRRSARTWLTARLRERRAVLQHAVMAWTQALAAPATRPLSIPAVWYQHNRPEPSSLIDWWAALSRCALVITNSRFTDSRQRAMNPLRRRTAIVYPPVPSPMPAEGTSLRTELDLAERSLLAVLPGRLQRWKGQDIAIRAIARVAGDVDVHLVLVGGTLFGIEAPYQSELRELSASLGISDRVHMLGFRERMAEVYASADMVLHTSRHPEPYGLVVAEAKTYGCAVIATNAGAIPEQIRDGETGLLVPPEDAEALARAVRDLAGSESRRRQLGTCAKQDAPLSPSEVARKIEDLYDQVLDA